MRYPGVVANGYCNRISPIPSIPGCPMSDHDDREHADTGADAESKVVLAEELFGEKREICIELDGVRYRLRITRRGKLILQK